MVFNYSSEWTSAILHVKTNSIECTSFTSYCQVSVSDSYRKSFFCKNFSGKNVWDAKSCTDVVRIFQSASHNFHHTFSRNYDLNIGVVMTVVISISERLMTILTYHYVFSSMFSSWVAFWYELTYILLDRPTGLYLTCDLFYRDFINPNMKIHVKHKPCLWKSSNNSY